MFLIVHDKLACEVSSTWNKYLSALDLNVNVSAKMSKTVKNTAHKYG
jgi:hypothetical protein